jgi:hypothetical protein
MARAVLVYVGRSSIIKVNREVNHDRREIVWRLYPQVPD